MLAKAVCGEMEFEGRHTKKKVARAIAAKKLLDALERSPSRGQVCGGDERELQVKVWERDTRACSLPVLETCMIAVEGLADVEFLVAIGICTHDNLLSKYGCIVPLILAVVIADCGLLAI